MMAVANRTAAVIGWAVVIGFAVCAGGVVKGCWR